MQRFGFNKGLNTALCCKCETEIDLDTPDNADVDLENPLCVRCRGDKGGGNVQELEGKYREEDTRHERKGG